VPKLEGAGQREHGDCSDSETAPNVGGEHHTAAIEAVADHAAQQ
jgi:hypothetical protein